MTAALARRGPIDAARSAPVDPSGSSFVEPSGSVIEIVSAMEDRGYRPRRRALNAESPEGVGTQPALAWAPSSSAEERRGIVGSSTAASGSDDAAWAVGLVA